MTFPETYKKNTHTQNKKPKTKNRTSYSLLGSLLVITRDQQMPSRRSILWHFLIQLYWNAITETEQLIPYKTNTPNKNPRMLCPGSNHSSDMAWYPRGGATGNWEGIPHPRDRQHSTGCCLQESCQRLTYNIITAPLKWTQLGSKKLEAKKGKVLDYWTKNTKCRALTMISKFLKQTISVSSYVTTTFIGKLPLQTESISSTTDIMRSISKCHDMQRARRNVAMVFKPAYSSVDKGLPYQV